MLQRSATASVTLDVTKDEGGGTTVTNIIHRCLNSLYALAHKLSIFIGCKIHLHTHFATKGAVKNGLQTIKIGHKCPSRGMMTATAGGGAASGDFDTQPSL